MLCATNWPPDINFFSDENLGRRIFPAPLQAAGVPLHIFFDHFASGVPDMDPSGRSARVDCAYL